MCTASLEKGYHWNSAKKTNASQKKQHVRFAMKLPLFSSQKVCNDDENNDISRERQYEDSVAASPVRQQAQCTWAAPHHAKNTTFNYGGGMRRVQSANASRPRGAVGAASGMNNPLGMAHKSRSHSQESRSSRNAVYEVAPPPPPPSEQLPIPQCKNTLLEIARTKSDQTDLRRMYDYATWNMYDRIVSARNKKRISEADNTDDLDALINGEGDKESSSSSSSKNNDKPSSIVTTTATTSCNSSFTSSPNQAAIACKGSGIIKTSGNNIKTTATIKKVQASTSSNTTNTTTSASATTTSSTQAMSTTSTYQQQASRTTSTTTTTKNTTNATTQTSSLHHKLRSINKAFSSHDTDSSQGGTAATESTSTESEDSFGNSRSGCNSPATFPGFMVGRSHRTMSQGSEDDHFIFQLDM